MNAGSLNPEQIARLLAGQSKDKPEPREFLDKPNSVDGPLHYFNKEQKCVGGYAESGKCKSPTSWTVNGIPLCYIHAMYALNDLIIYGNVGAAWCEKNGWHNPFESTTGEKKVEMVGDAST